ncbi:GntR family transcriptional regulator [Microbacterium sp. 1P10UB]|uniref:GntR family transcriptional regulator n=1 Tax=unclassified Microbacterium TaxID=2609290 RepID=UPI0039A25A96
MQRTHSTGATADYLSLARELRRAIVRGDYVPHQRLTERALEQRYSAPRSAVRNALISLVHSGLIEHTPYQGVRVRKATAKEIAPLLEASSAIQELCAQKAAVALSASDVIMLTSIRNSYRSASSFAELSTVLMFHARVCGLLGRFGRQPVSVEMLEQLDDRLHQHLLTEKRIPDVAAPLSALTDRLVDAVIASDPAAAVAAIRDRTVFLIRQVRGARREGK